MAKKRKFYTVSGMKRVCMGTDTLSYPPLFTSKKAAAKKPAAKKTAEKKTAAKKTAEKKPAAKKTTTKKKKEDAK